MIKWLKKEKHVKTPIRSCSIGIAGLAPGSGTTHVSLIIAGFLHSYFGKKTLLAEAYKQNVLHHWLAAEDKKQELIRHGIMYMLGIDKEELMQIKNMGYTYCVIDFGNFCERASEELMRCDIKIIVGTAAVWKKNMWVQAENMLKKVKDSSTFCFLINFGDISDDIKKKLRPAKTFKMPYEPDLSRISEETVYLLRRIFLEYS